MAKPHRKIGRAKSTDTETVNAELFKTLSGMVERKILSEQDGWRTVAQWAEEWNVSRQHALRLLQRGAKAGIIETDKASRQQPGGRWVAANVYRAAK